VNDMGNPWVKISDLYPYLLKPIPASMDRGFTGTGAGFSPICRVTLPRRPEIGTGKMSLCQSWNGEGCTPPCHIKMEMT